MGSDKRLREGDRVTVYWDDAWASTATWDMPAEKDELLKPWPQKNHGEVFAVNKDFVCLAHDFDVRHKDATGKNRSRNVQTIPRKYITKIERLVVEK